MMLGCMVAPLAHLQHGEQWPGYQLEHLFVTALLPFLRFWGKSPDETNPVCHHFLNIRTPPICPPHPYTLCCLWCLRCHQCLTVRNPTLLVTIVNGRPSVEEILILQAFFHICPGLAREWQKRDSWPRLWAIVYQFLPQNHRSIDSMGLMGIPLHSISRFHVMEAQ